MESKTIVFAARGFEPDGSKKEFKYEWVTKVDEDGSWALVVASSQEQRGTTYDPLFAEYETNTFSNLLHALYSKRYEIFTAHEIIHLTELADYNCALPIVSNAIGYPISLAHRRIDIQHHCVDLIMPAFKLRHRELFQDCVIYLAGNWDSTAEVDSPSWDQKVRDVVVKARERIRLQIENVHDIILKLSAEYPVIAQAFSKVQPSAGHPLPNYYRRLYKEILTNTPKSEFGDMFFNLYRWTTPLLCNSLQWPRYYDEAGEGNYEDFFLCAEVEGEDLPWDTT